MRIAPPSVKETGRGPDDAIPAYDFTARPVRRGRAPLRRSLGGPDPPGGARYWNPVPPDRCRGGNPRLGRERGGDRLCDRALPRRGEDWGGRGFPGRPA